MGQCRLAYFDHGAGAGQERVGDRDGGGAVVGDVLVAGFLDAVGVVASSFDGAGAGAGPARGVEVGFAGDVGHGLGEDVAGLVRGGKAGPTARRMTRTVRLNLTRSGS